MRQRSTSCDACLMLPDVGEEPMGVYPDGDVESRFSIFCFGPKNVPKDPFGVEMGPIGEKNARSPNPGSKNPKIFKKAPKS